MDGPTKDAPIPEVLTIGELKSLIAAAGQSSHARREVVIVLLAARAGMSAREQCRMDISHVSAHGRALTHIVVPGRPTRFPSLPSGAVPIPNSVRGALSALMESIQSSCRHGDGRFGRDVLADGTEVCHVCHRPLDFNKTPLLLSRAGARLSERQVHKIFARLRTAAGIDDRVTFRALLAAYQEHVKRVVTHALQTDALGDVTATPAAQTH